MDKLDNDEVDFEKDLGELQRAKAFLDDELLNNIGEE